MTYKEHIVLNVRSIDRKRGTATRFIYESRVPITFSVLKGRQYFVRAENIIVPYSFYFINSTNNTLSITETAGGTFSVVITPGNYTINEFITELIEELNNQSLQGNTYSVVHDQNTGKLIFSYTGTSTSVQFNDTGSTMFPLLGFEQGTNHTITGSGVGNAITGQYISFLERTRFLKLKVSGSNFTISNSYDANGVDNTISRFPVITDFFTDNYYPNKEGFSGLIKIEPNNSAKTLQIELTDENDIPVELNGEEWGFQMAIYEWRK